MEKSPLFLCSVLGSVLIASPVKSADLSELLDPGQEIKKLADGFGFGEGPAWHPGEQALYFSDLKNKTIHRWSASDGLSTVRQGVEVFANGIVVDPEGRLVFCETGAFRIVRREADGSETVLADKVGDQSLGMTNDLWMTPDGGIYFTVPNKPGSNEKFTKEGRLLGTIVYLSPKGITSDVGAAVGVKAPNGIVGSIDGKRLYFRDRGECRVAEILPDGSLANAKIAAPKGTDGLTLDEKGNLYTTSKDGVEIFGPDASRVGLIPVPETPANLTFGGKDGRTLFITARTSLYSVEMKVKGDAFADEEQGEEKQVSAALSNEPSRDKHLEAFLGTHCYECHDDLTSESDLDLLSLPMDFSDPEKARSWATVFRRVEAGEMPPQEKERPSPADLETFLDRLSGGLAAAERERISLEGRAMVRRLNRLEFQHTLADLLALPHLEIIDALPPEGSSHGFDKTADALDFSHVHASRFMEVVDTVLRKAVASQVRKPESKRIRVEMKDPENVKANLGGFYAMLKQTEAIPLNGMEIDTTITSVRGDFQKRDPGLATDEPPFFDALAIFNNGAFNLVMNVKQFEVPVDGRYTIRVHGFGILNDHGVLAPSDRLETVGFYTEDRTLGFVDLPAYEATTGELKVWLEEGEKIKPLVASSPNAKIQTPLKVKPGEVVPVENFGYRKFESRGVAFRWLELEGPHTDQWPPESHRRLFGNLKMVPGDPIEVVPNDASSDARRLMRQFAVRALRRPVTADDMKVPMQVVMQKLRRNESFLEAMIAGYRTVLVSPEFLLMSGIEPGPLPGEALAERLSYFLWNSAPDEQLRELGRSGKLSDPAVLREQTERLLADRKSDRFVAHFLDKWLKLEDISLTEPDGNLYPEYNPLLTDSALWETRAYFRELIDKDLGAEYLAHSDFVMVNQRLAELYEIPGVAGNEIRRIPLPDGSVRGGLLTQASVLKTTANGTTTSPVVRGDYVMTHLLGDPPPPPPPSVPAVEPDISGATTVREQLALHSQDKSCAACHAKIDPPGFALESFDVMGGFRKRYRSIEKGDLIPNLYHEGKLAKTRLALPVDASGELPDGTGFRGIRDFKSILLARTDQLARNLLEQFVVFGTGAPVGFADEKAVDEMMTSLADSRYGVRSMIHAVIQSSLFLEK